MGPPRRISSRAFPWTTATAAQVCCAVLTILATSAERQSTSLLLHLLTASFFSSRFSSFPDAAQALMLFLGHPDRLLVRIPTSGEPIIFPCEKRVLPFILEIVTQQCEGELCTQGLPAARHIWGITFQSERSFQRLACIHSSIVFNLSHFILWSLVVSPWPEPDAACKNCRESCYSPTWPQLRGKMFNFFVVLVNTSI